MNTKNNQRFKDSEKKIQDALMKLMENQELQEVTVRDICELAKINRTTFYAHYDDIYDLMTKTERIIRQDLVGTFQSQEIRMQNVFHHDFLLFFLRHIAENRTFYRICLRRRTKFPIEEGFEELFRTVVKPHCEQHGVTDENKMLYYLTFYQAGLTMILRRWVETGCTETPEELRDILADCLPLTELL